MFKDKDVINYFMEFDGEEEYWASLSPQERLTMAIELSSFSLNFLPPEYSIERIEWQNGSI